jgi:two-component system, sensor histidine kinase and response regulator
MGGESSTILVVDDNEANRSLAQSTLEDEGFRVVTATDGKEALAAFTRESPDCVLLDVRMPGVDGFEVCKRMRELPNGPDVPVIFLTALRDVDTFDRALRAGGDDFLTKPARPTEIVSRVQGALKLRRLNVELRVHYEQLKQQRNDLLRLQLQKERLTAFVVHDLKNPVSAMDLHAQLLLRDQTLKGASRESVEHIRSNARQLTRMIMNLLDVSKADEGRLTPKCSDIDLGKLVREVLSELEVHAQGRRVELRTSIEVTTLRADENLLRRTLTNLVENAIRYTPSKTYVSVSTKPWSDGVELRIADAGHGIAPEQRDKVFDPFVQLNPDGTEGGRGLGLSFCKVAVEAHGGRIWVEDANPGAMFCVRLPNGG